jgi:hypothetical protein
MLLQVKLILVFLLLTYPALSQNLIVRPQLESLPSFYTILFPNQFSKSCSNSGFHLLSLTTNVWQNEKWNKEAIVIYDYNKSNLLLSEYTKKWDGLKWNDSSCIIHSYDSLNQEIEVLHQNTNQNQWINTDRERSEIWTSARQTFHEQFINNNWSIIWMEIIERSKTQETRGIFMPNSDGFYQIGRSYAKYNELGNIVESAFYWTGAGSEVLSSMEKYYYDSLNRIVKFTGGADENIKEVFEYNEQNNSSIKTRYLKTDSLWLPVYRDSSNYDLNKNEILVKEEIYDNGIWKNSTLEEKTYDRLLAVKEMQKLPSKYQLFQNYPNPFNPSTRIKFMLPERSMVKLYIYNVTGEKVATLVNGVLGSGEYEYEFNASQYASGVYFCKLITPVRAITKKMVFTK